MRVSFTRSSMVRSVCCRVRSSVSSNHPSVSICSFPLLSAPGTSSSIRSEAISSGERIKDRAFCEWLTSRTLFQTDSSGILAEQNTTMISSFLTPQTSASMVERSSSSSSEGSRYVSNPLLSSVLDAMYFWKTSSSLSPAESPNLLLNVP